MLRILFGATALALCTPAAFACDGQTGKVIFEDKFTDDTGGWAFGEDYDFLLTAPGATLKLKAGEKGAAQARLNETFSARQGDFCVEMSFPPDAAQLDAAIGVVFLAADYTNMWQAQVRADGGAGLFKLTGNKFATVWKTAAANDLVKTGPTDVSSVRAVVKDGMITIIVNGKTVKSVRAQMPGGDLKFGFVAQYYKPSATPVLFPVRSYKVTAVE